MISTDIGLFTATTQEKGDKGKEIVNRTILEMETEEDGKVNRKISERGRGFLIHLARTYPGMVPFLKGIHHTLETWRGGRDVDGWKFGREAWFNLIDEGSDYQDWKEIMNVHVTKGNPPHRVTTVDRLKADLHSLRKMMSKSKPPNRLIRYKGMEAVIYSFGDASGAGFGSTWSVGEATKYRVGVWGNDTKDKSSNFRELKNLVETIQAMIRDTNLNGVTIHLFTDNSTAEYVFYKEGSSKSKLLHEMVTSLREIELNHGCKISIVHVSGERMKAQGSDGLSRGNMLEGVMQSKDILSFIPLHLSALKREGGSRLLTWIKSWGDFPEEKLRVLSEHEWFTRGQDIVGFTTADSLIQEPVYKSRSFLWAPLLH